MIIRSQDKKKIFDMAGTTIKINGKNEIIGYGNNQATDECEFLGGYSTEEKAIKVLDMIEKEYIRTTDLDHEWKSSILFCVPRSNVFQMPQDSEV